MSRDLVPELLGTASRSLLENIVLTRMNRAANISKQIRELADQRAEELAEAYLAKYLLEHGDELRRCATLDAQQESFDFPRESRAELAALPRVVVSGCRETDEMAHVGNRKAVR